MEGLSQFAHCRFSSVQFSHSVVSDSVRPHRRQPTRLPHPWDSPGNNTGVGCHFLLQCMKVKNESEVAQSCPTLSDPTDCSLPGSSIHGIFQARVLEWGAIAFSAVVVLERTYAGVKPHLGGCSDILQQQVVLRCYFLSLSHCSLPASLPFFHPLKILMGLRYNSSE